MVTLITGINGQDGSYLSELLLDKGWSHEYTFESMLDEMIDYWMDYYTIK